MRWICGVDLRWICGGSAAGGCGEPGIDGNCAVTHSGRSFLFNANAHGSAESVTPGIRDQQTSPPFEFTHAFCASASASHAQPPHGGIAVPLRMLAVPDRPER